MDIFKHHHVDGHGTIQPTPELTKAPEINADGAVTALLVLALALAIVWEKS